MIDAYRKLLPKRFNTYWEPFLGGGALFFHLRPDRARLSDINPHLCAAWRAVKCDPETVIDRLSSLRDSHGSEQYYSLRDQLGAESNDAETAALVIYLNRTCFNGLWRVNRSGQFNVPIGSYSNPAILNAENLRACSRALKRATIACRSYRRIAPKAGDFVYADPPYDLTFNSYAADSFQADDQEQLRDRAVAWHEAGARVMLSNADTSYVRSLYGGTGSPFNLRIVAAPRHINREPTGRGKVAELVIRNWK